MSKSFGNDSTLMTRLGDRIRSISTIYCFNSQAKHHLLGSYQYIVVLEKRLTTHWYIIALLPFINFYHIFVRLIWMLMDWAISDLNAKISTFIPSSWIGSFQNIIVGLMPNIVRLRELKVGNESRGNAQKLWPLIRQFPRRNQEQFELRRDKIQSDIFVSTQKGILLEKSTRLPSDPMNIFVIVPNVLERHLG